MLNKERNANAVHPLRDAWRKPMAVWRDATIRPLMTNSILHFSDD
jgi:hypothetical protein